MTQEEHEQERLRLLEKVEELKRVSRIELAHAFSIQIACSRSHGLFAV